MEQHSKQSGGSATNSAHNVFFYARLKLTGIYVLILAVILIGFSAYLYQAVKVNLLDALDGEFVDAPSQFNYSERTLHSVEIDLIIVDIIILIVAAGASYVLAGYTLKPIQRALEAQRKFSENASHELRTPLAVMKSDIEVLLRNQNPSKENVHAVLASNIEEIDRMTKMSEDLLMIARSENNTLSFGEINNVAEIVTNTAEKMKSIASEKGVSINIKSDEPIEVKGNKDALERTVMNLIKNAIEHTPKGGSITVNTAKGGPDALITIADTGTGIDEKDLPHILSRFYKGDGSQGSGLGLSIVKELVSEHGGNINIISAKGEGTTITISLPLLS